ncbi:methionine adenosyltransferase [archaeon]|nr:methionine adenosyltransferase [archaeon]
MEKLFTSESVTEGHPDKMCDQISDAILDEHLKQDKNSRVAIETLVKNDLVILAGEISSNAKVNLAETARNVIKEIGYEYNPKIIINVTKQSQEISQGVNKEENKEQGAGDQGMMFGYACNETDNYLPLPIYLAHKLTKKLTELRKSKEINYIMPDGKSQVTVKYHESKPNKIQTIVLSTQHNEIDRNILERDILEKVIKPVCKTYLDENTKFLINPTGSFIKGGPEADVGVTGRKIIVDTYGGMGKHGGGAFSGKDPSKVDRSAAYAARFIAKNLVANKLCQRCEVGLSYAIGVAEPVSIFIDSFGTSELSEEKLIKIVKENFPLKPSEIIEYFDLRKPIYKQTSTNGHFTNEDFAWEKIIKINH